MTPQQRLRWWFLYPFLGFSLLNGVYEISEHNWWASGILFAAAAVTTAIIGGLPWHGYDPVYEGAGRSRNAAVANAIIFFVLVFVATFVATGFYFGRSWYVLLAIILLGPVILGAATVFIVRPSQEPPAPPNPP